MPIVHVDSLEDPRLAAFRQLPKTSVERASDYFIVEGRLLVERLLTSDYETDSILVDGDRTDKLPNALDPSTTVYTTPPGFVDQLIGFDFHRGVLACGRRRPLPAIGSVVSEDASPLLIACCVQIADPVNLGGILRNCVAFGVDIAIVDRDGADAFSRRALRVSMGAPFTLTLVESKSLFSDLAQMKQLNIEMCATVVSDHAEPLETATRSRRMCLLFGNEGHGLSQAVCGRCDRQLTIPMELGTDSLNAAVSSGVFLYHFTRVCRS